MAFSRTFLKSLGLEEDKITAIMEEHTAVADALKKQRDEYKEVAEKLPTVQKELDGLKNGEDFKTKYDQEHEAFENYKKQVQQEADAAKVKAAYRELLVGEKISEKRLDAILKITDYTNMKLDKDGKLENADALKEGIKKDWSEFIVKTEQRGADVETPPVHDNGGSGMSRARELANKYYAEKYGAPKGAEKE